MHADTIARVAGHFLASGLIQVCVWGPDCQRVHDIFDEVHVGDGGVEPGFTLMSTWHSDDSIEEALWYFIEYAFPLDTEIETTSYLAVVVGSNDWAATVENALSNLGALKARILGEDPENDCPGTDH